MLASLALFQVLTYAEDDLKTGGQGQLGLHDQLLIGLTIILTTLGVTQDGVLATQGGEHVHGHFTGVGTFLVVCAVLGAQLHLGTLEDLCHRGQVGERRSNYQFNVCGEILGFLHNSLGEFYAFGHGGVHFPVARYNVFSHNYLTDMTAEAIEFNFTSTESAREARMQGTLVPTRKPA